MGTIPTRNLNRVAYKAEEAKIASNLRSQAPGQIGSGSFLSETAFRNNGALQSFLIGSFSSPGRFSDPVESHCIEEFGVLFALMNSPLAAQLQATCEKST